MKELPVIELETIVLRPFTLEDADDVQRMAGDRSIAEMTLNIPHPYKDGMAESWIKRHQEDFRDDISITLAVEHKNDKFLIGTVGMGLNKDYDRAELGYWIGKPYWGNGYCTEAARGLLQYGFEEMGLNKIYACHFEKNPASGKVMKKIGMKYEGLFRQHVKKWGEYINLLYYSILQEEYLASKR